MQPTILILEDDTVLRELLCEVLRDEGYQVIDSDSLAGLLHQTPSRPHLLITDLLMNFELIGLRAIEQVRQHTEPHLPVLICSAAQTEIERYTAEIMRLKAHVLPKPFTIDQLIDAVHAALQPPLFQGHSLAERAAVAA